MNTLKFATDIHQDTYACIAVSTSHFTESDLAKLSATTSSNMIMERDTGFFIKLYNEKEYNQDLCDNLTHTAQDVIMACHEAGFRLIEIDNAADELLEYS